MGKGKASPRRVGRKRLAPGQVVFRWSLDEQANENEAARLTASLQQTGGRAEIVQHQTRPLWFVIPIVIAGAVIGVALAEQVYDWWDKRHKHGLLIHVKKNGELDIKALEGLPYGQVLFIGAGGKEIKYVNVSQDKLKSILDAASKGLTPPKS